ncbi:MAG: 50S ribosomal protein L13 [Elusimicrobiota bacterium]
MKKTFMIKEKDIKRVWYTIDATDQPLGRLSTKAATILMGKNAVSYTPGTECGNFVVITNAAKVKLTGMKIEQKVYWRHTGFLGGVKEEAYKDLMKTDPAKIVELSVSGMLPKNKLRPVYLRRLKIFTAAPVGITEAGLTKVTL